MAQRDINVGQVFRQLGNGSRAWGAMEWCVIGIHTTLDGLPHVALAHRYDPSTRKTVSADSLRNPRLFELLGDSSGRS